MEIKSRKEALIAPPTPKSKLRAFEQRIYDLGECTPNELYWFLNKNNAEIMFSPEWGLLFMGIGAYLTNEINLNDMKLWGDPLGCNYQFRKTARRESRSILPQRYHGRVYIDAHLIVVVIETETETDPQDVPSGIIHLLKNPEHRIIRLRRK